MVYCYTEQKNPEFSFVKITEHMTWVVCTVVVVKRTTIWAADGIWNSKTWPEFMVI